MKVYIYESSREYNSENPAVEVEVSKVDILDDRIEGYDRDGYKHVWNNFFALTFENNYNYGFNGKEVYLYETAKAYDRSNPEITLTVGDVEFKRKFIVLRNEYVHVINEDNILAFVYR